MERTSATSTAVIPGTFQVSRDDVTGQIGLFWHQMKPEKRYKWEPMKDDVELGSSAYPMVLIQIPMYNEKEVYQLSIGAACGLSWPADRIIIQVLDDSTDHTIKHGGTRMQKMRKQRDKHKPEPDFLWRTIPFLVNNPEIALVQARWKFVNANECLMTRMQEMSLDYHFKVEQEVGSSTYAFFGFNGKQIPQVHQMVFKSFNHTRHGYKKLDHIYVSGTAGVWRISAINEAGRWKDRTTVEDMDLAVRVLRAGNSFTSATSSLFFVRKIVAHIVTFVFYCLVLPSTVFVPEVHVPKWGAVYIPSIITLLNAVGTPRSLHLVMFWILFENVMSLHRTKATFIGLLEAGRLNEWVVTEKLGDALKTKVGQKLPRNPESESEKGNSQSVNIYHLRR
ncbi:putative mannan synthase 3 [Hibiscus syriacus]|uniref:Mannan synthase 3 n=1 Tax=Hibiscus syriacus TaxID=106335 RepID=A0A6A2YW44_HIBSY|nr:putative mannan synthase 3 [Hibiscus syriacus]